MLRPSITMEVKMMTIKKRKPHADNTGLCSLLAGANQSTTLSISNDPILKKLLELKQDVKLLHIDHFSITDGEKAGEIIDTDGKVALVMHDNSYRPVSLAIYTPNSNEKVKLTDPSQPSAFIIGNLSLDSDWYAVSSLDEAVQLYDAMAVKQGLNVTILVSLNPYGFNSMVKHFAEVKQVIVTTTLEKPDHLIKPLLGLNIKAIITTFDLLLSFENGLTLGDVINDPETMVRDLQLEAWGKLGNIADADSKATPYPVEAWGNEGEVLRDALEAITYYSQIPVALAGQCILGALATVIQQYINAPYPTGSGFMPASLFLLTEIESGGGKSKTTSMYSHKELIDYQKEKRKEYRILRDEWLAEKATKAKKDLDKWLLDNPKPKQPILFAKSGTLIGFLDNMILGNTRNVAWATAEAGLFLGSHSLTNETAKSNISQICDIWSSGEFDRMLSPRYNSNFTDENGIDGIRFTLDLQGQPPIVAPALNNEVMSGQGLLPRFLFAFPESLNGTLVFNTDERLDAKPEKDPRLIAYWQRCRALLTPVASNVKTDNEGNIIRYNMPFENRQARKALADYQTEKERQLVKGGKLEKYAEYVKRLHENASRIASILAYFNGRRFISADDIKRATLLTDYSMKERIRYTDKPQAGDNDAQKLVNWLVRYCHNRSVKELAYSTAQSKVTPKHLRLKQNFELLAEVLESEGYIKVITNGRARTIQVRPELLEAT